MVDYEMPVVLSTGYWIARYVTDIEGGQRLEWE